MDTDPMDLSPDVPDHRPRESTQADYANAILNGTANLGDSLEAFSNTVRRDLTQFSIIKDNCYLLDFYTERSQSILPPSMDISTYQHRVVLQNALLEFSLEDYQWINPTSVRWTAFSVAILHLVAESGTLFCWTAELLRRCTSKGKEKISWQKTRLIKTFSTTVDGW